MKTQSIYATVVKIEDIGWKKQAPFCRITWQLRVPALPIFYAKEDVIARIAKGTRLYQIVTNCMGTKNISMPFELMDILNKQYRIRLRSGVSSL